MTAGERRVPAWTADDTTGAKVGDPVPLGGEIDCPAVFDDWLCTANAGHAGPHIASGYTTVHAVWTDNEGVTA